MLFMFTNVSFAQNRGQGQGRGYGNKQYNGVNERDREEHNMYRERYDRDRDDYRGQPGYHRDYGNYRYNHYYDRYTYHGHWNNRRDWDRYYYNHPEYHHHGHYETLNGMLFFFFNDGINSFGFSIGGH